MKIFITGILGMVGSRTAIRFLEEGHEVTGVDNGFRSDFIKASEDMTIHDELIGLGAMISAMDIVDLKPEHLEGYDVVIHTAAQPSHEYSITQPKIDFYVNAKGTFKLLDACRQLKDKPIVIYTSTIKVYGDVINQFDYTEGKFRYFLEEPESFDETISIDGSGHSPFGVSKLSADLYCQEFAKLYKMDIGVFRLGCITGPTHRGVELHGFLSYLIKCGAMGKEYNIFGNGKQVRDQIHVEDLIDAFVEFINDPKSGVYNLGGGIENSISILEAINTLDTDYGVKINYTHKPERFADHKYWVTDNSKFMRNYHGWSIKRDLKSIFKDIISFYK